MDMNLLFALASVDEQALMSSCLLEEEMKK
ncbi:MAG: hypothetical protein ACFWT6_13280 [Virgibacillus proomii]|jgi:hypothetical protein